MLGTAVAPARVFKVSAPAFVHVAALTALVLVATVFVPGETAAAAPAVRSDVPVLQSEPLADTVSSVPEGVFEAPALPAAEAALFYNQAPGIDLDAESLGEVTDQSEVISQTEFSTTFLNADGTNTTRLSTEPLNALVDGEWQEVETAVSAEGDGAWGSRRTR